MFRLVKKSSTSLGSFTRGSFGGRSPSPPATIYWEHLRIRHVPGTNPPKPPQRCTPPRFRMSGSRATPPQGWVVFMYTPFLNVNPKYKEKFPGPYPEFVPKWVYEGTTIDEKKYNSSQGFVVHPSFDWELLSTEYKNFINKHLLPTDNMRSPDELAAYEWRKHGKYFPYAKLEHTLDLLIFYTRIFAISTSTYYLGRITNGKDTITAGSLYDGYVLLCKWGFRFSVTDLGNGDYGLLSIMVKTDFDGFPSSVPKGLAFGQNCQAHTIIRLKRRN